MKVVFICDRIGPPYDEGIKNIVFYLVRCTELLCNVSLVTDGASGIARHTTRVRLGKLFLTWQLAVTLRRFRNQGICVYVPFSSLTAASLGRLLIVRLFLGATPVIAVGLQHRHLSLAGRILLRLARPSSLVVLSRKMAKEIPLEYDVKIFTPGVDLARFSYMPLERRRTLREKFGFRKEDFVVLHVGHLKKNRNLPMLVDASVAVGAKIVVVGSTTFQQESDETVVLRIEQAGGIVIQETIQAMEEIYGLADCYAFPVVEVTGATEMPLSVLEAMACNIPVVTTRYGALPEHFSENRDAGFFYCSTCEEFTEALHLSRTLRNVDTRAMVQTVGWEQTVDRLWRDLSSVVTK